MLSRPAVLLLLHGSALAAPRTHAIPHLPSPSPSPSPPPPPPPGCEGTQCRRSRCGDICTATDCSHLGNVCAGGASAPVGVGWTYESKFVAPELPPDFTPENATIFVSELLARPLLVLRFSRGRGSDCARSMLAEVTS